MTSLLLLCILNTHDPDYSLGSIARGLASGAVDAALIVGSRVALVSLVAGSAATFGVAVYKHSKKADDIDVVFILGGTAIVDTAASVLLFALTPRYPDDRDLLLATGIPLASMAISAGIVALVWGTDRPALAVAPTAFKDRTQQLAPGLALSGSF